MSFEGTETSVNSGIFRKKKMSSADAMVIKALHSLPKDFVGKASQRITSNRAVFSHHAMLLTSTALTLYFPSDLTARLTLRAFFARAEIAALDAENVADDSLAVFIVNDRELHADRMLLGRLASGRRDRFATHDLAHAMDNELRESG